MKTTKKSAAAKVGAASPKKTAKKAAKPKQPAQSPKDRIERVQFPLTQGQIIFMDRLALNIREKSGASVSRAEIVRALLNALQRSGLDLSDKTSGAQMEEELLNRWKVLQSPKLKKKAAKATKAKE